MRLGSFLWLALCCMLLGVYSLYMLAGTVVVVFLYVIIRDYPKEKARRRKIKEMERRKKELAERRNRT